jgi:hypothetical protein
MVVIFHTSILVAYFQTSATPCKYWYKNCPLMAVFSKICLFQILTIKAATVQRKKGGRVKVFGYVASVIFFVLGVLNYAITTDAEGTLRASPAVPNRSVVCMSGVDPAVAPIIALIDVLVSAVLFWQFYKPLREVSKNLENSKIADAARRNFKGTAVALTTSVVALVLIGASGNAGNDYFQFFAFGFYAIDNIVNMYCLYYIYPKWKEALRTEESSTASNGDSSNVQADVPDNEE